MRSRFDEQLTQLNNELLSMGALIEHAIESASEALVQRNVEQARRAIAFDREVDEKEHEIEGMCLKLLLKQQPVARDLRTISAALKMITDMERIGDQAADISEIVIMLGETPIINGIEHLPQMAAATINMVTTSIDAFVQRDLDLARKVIGMDDIVDDLFDVVKNELIDSIRSDRSNGSQAMDLLMIAKYFERIGDHAENIAEWVEYSITGIHKGDVQV